MPRSSDIWVQRIKTVEQEQAATRLAMVRLIAAVEQDSSILHQGPQGLKLRDLRHALERLEGTYIIRLFAEFEAGLRRLWQAARATDPPSRTRDLVDGIAASRRVPDEPRQQVHAVREYRNTLVHEREEEAGPIPIAAARGHLCRFFNFLPALW
jgi:hypothetical protein